MSLFDLALKVKAKNGILQRFINDKDWSQNDFARELGIDPGTVGRWFNMRDYPRTFELMNKVCLLINRTPEEIFPDFLKNSEIMDSEREWVIYKKINLEFLPLNDFLALPAPEKDYDDFEMKDKIIECLQTLTPREEKIIRMRFGLELEKEHTVEEIGEEFGVSHERIRQIEIVALRKLKHSSRAKGLKDFISV